MDESKQRILLLSILVFLVAIIAASLLVFPKIGFTFKDSNKLCQGSGYSFDSETGLCLREFDKHFCTSPQGDFCTLVYQPVCGLPEKKTYSNSCFACKEVSVYVEGECNSLQSP